MDLSCKKTVHGCFKISCLLATLIAIGYWCYKFSLDEDVCLIDYKTYYEEAENSFPVMSLCFPLNKQLANYSENTMSASTMNFFLKQKTMTSRKEKEVFNNLKIDLNRYIKSVWVRWLNGTTHYFTPEDAAGWKIPYNSYIGFFKKNFLQCYAMEITDRNIKVLKFFIRSRIFRNETRPYKFKFSVYFHYPNQILRSLGTVKSVWPRRAGKYGYVMHFQITNAEVLKRRNKGRQPCVEAKLKFDNEIISQHYKNICCVPSFSNSTENLPYCIHEKNKKSANLDISSEKVYQYPPPCRSMEKIDYTYEEIEAHGIKKRCNDCFAVSYSVFHRTFKEITQIRALNIQALIGNSGAYLGLFCGYTMLQLPDMILRVYEYFSKTICDIFKG